MNTLVVGTRGSLLARKQTEIFCSAIRQISPDVECRVEIITTQGDARTTEPIGQIGDKRVFTKELEDGLLEGRIDAAVHSAKDLVSPLPAGLSIGSVLPRSDRADAFCSLKYKSLDELPAGARVGSGSIRRRAQILGAHPHVRVVGIRGNVDTRMKKLVAGEFDALVLAVSGLERIGRKSDITMRLDPRFFLPAPAQGAIAVEYRSDRRDIADLLVSVSDSKSYAEIKAERALLERLEAGCSVPLGASAELQGDRMVLTAGLFSPDGKRRVIRQGEGSKKDPVSLGWEVARLLLRDGGQSILDELKQHGKE